MNSINSISCQPLQPKNQVSFKGREKDSSTTIVPSTEVLDELVKNPDAMQQVSDFVINIADKGNKGTKTLGTLAMIAGIGTGSYVVANKAARRVFSSVTKNTQYFDGVSKGIVGVFHKLEKKAAQIEAGEQAGKLKKALVKFVKGLPDAARNFATKDLDDDVLRKKFASSLTKGAADLTDEEKKNFPKWLKEAKDLDLGVVKKQFADKLSVDPKNVDVKSDDFVNWIQAEKGVDLRQALSDYAQGFRKSVDNLNHDDLAKFGIFEQNMAAKNGVSKVVGAGAGLGAGANTISSLGKDENGDKIPDAFQQQTTKDKFNQAVGTIVLNSVNPDTSAIDF